MDDCSDQVLTGPARQVCQVCVIASRQNSPNLISSPSLALSHCIFLVGKVAGAADAEPTLKSQLGAFPIEPMEFLCLEWVEGRTGSFLLFFWRTQITHDLWKKDMRDTSLGFHQRLRDLHFLLAGLCACVCFKLVHVLLVVLFIVKLLTLVYMQLNCS